MESTRDATATNTLEYREQTREIEKLKKKVDELRNAFEGVGRVTAEGRVEIGKLTKEQEEALEKLADLADLQTKAQRDAFLAQKREEIRVEKERGELWQRRIDMADQALEAIDQISQAFLNKELDRIDKKQDELDNYYDKLLDNERLTDKQRDAIEAEREQKEEQLAKRREEAEKKAFLIKQAFALGQIAIDLARSLVAINTAANVISILNPVAGQAYRAAQIPIAIGTAALQTAVVLAQTIPQFEKGKKDSDRYEGAMIWGEKRPEVKVSKEGNIEVATQPTLGYTKPGDTIFPSFEAFGKSDIYNQAIAMQLADHNRKLSTFQTGNTEVLIRKMIDKMADIKVHNHNHLPKNNDIDKLARKMATLQKANKI